MTVASFRRLSIGVLLYTLGVILWGALVRATGSGAGCGSHWPACNGEIVPHAPSIATLIEYTHRLTSGVALIAVVVLGVAAFRTFPPGHLVRRGAVWSIVFMLTEALVGAGLVLLEYVAQDTRAGRGVWMAVHLVNTFLLLAALTYTVARAEERPAPLVLRGQGSVGSTIALSFAGLLLLGVTGAIAALGDTLHPSASLAEGLAQDLSPTTSLLVRLRVLHPVVAMIVGIGLVLTASHVARQRPSMQVRRWAGAVHGLFATQFALGLVNLVLLAPVWMQLVHLLFADLLWMSLVVFATVALGEGVQRAEVPITSAATS